MANMANMSAFKAQLERAANRDLKAVMVEQKINKLFHDDAAKSDRYGLHASAILSSDNDFCYREQLLSLFYKRDTGKEFDTKLLRIFAQGTATHIKWQEMFRKAGWLKCSEYTHFIPEYDLCFTPDMETNWKREPLFEIKTENTYSFQKSGNHHAKGEKQLNFYLCLLDIPEGYVLVEDKNTQEIKIITVKQDREKAEPFFVRLREIQEMKKLFLSEHEVPRRKSKDANCKRCMECAMRSACWNIGQGRIKLPKELRQATEYKAKD